MIVLVTFFMIYFNFKLVFKLVQDQYDYMPWQLGRLGTLAPEYWTLRRIRLQARHIKLPHYQFLKEIP